MKKWLKTGKKALSVIMAVMMVLSAWVWVAPTEASAANGSYYVKVTYNVTNEGTLESAYNGKTEQNDSAGITLTYAENNGRSSTTGTKDWDIKSNVATKKDGYTATATISGFPIELYASVDDNTWATTTIQIVKLECGSSSSNLKTLWTGTMQLSSSYNRKYRTLGSDGSTSGTDDTSVSNSDVSGWIYPYVPSANTISATTAVADIGIPPLGDKKDTLISTRSIQYYASDYYGVRYEPTSYSVSGVQGLTTGTSWSCGSAYPITATTSTTKSTVSASQTATVTMNWNNGKSTSGQKADTTATFNVYNPRYKISYDGNGGTLGTAHTYAYYGRTIGDTTSIATTNNVAGLSNELVPTTGIKEGYTFGGMYTSASGGSKISGSTTVSADVTYYAHWDINKYTATFYGTKANDAGTGTVEYIISTSNVDYNSNPVAPSTVDGYSLGDYDYTFDGWDKEISPIGIDGAEYRATYTSAFVPANYDAVNEIVDEANDIINSANYELIYSEESRNALENAIDSVVYNQGRTSQAVVDAYVPMIREAIDGLGRQKYSILFIDSVDNSVISMSYPVYYGDQVKFPDDPDRGFTTTDHYVFTGWESSESGDDITFVSKNMVILANFDKVAHTFTDTELPSNCTTQTGVLHKCDCGYEYVEYSGSVGTEHDLDEEYTIDIEPTCTSVGSKSRHCSRCSYREDVTEIPALDHDFTDGYQGVVINPGCENDGAEVSECQRCGYDKYSIVPAGGHNWSEEVIAPTCTASGYTLKTCSNCYDEDVISFTDPIAHSYTEAVDEYIAPTCTGLGKKVYYCSCGAQKVDTVSATGHTWKTNTTVDFEATCTTKGQQSIHCSVCDVINAESIEEISENGHIWGAEVCEQRETCGVKGLYVKTCGVCSVNSSRTTEALTHKYNTETIAATCIEAGKETTACENCGDINGVEILQPLGHKYENSGAITDVATTCTTPAYKIYKCDTCDIENTVYTIGSATLPHDFTGTESNVVNATCTADGSKTVQCKNCTQTINVVLPKLGHSYGEWVVVKEATNTEDGQWKRVCANDENHIEYVTIPAGNHNLVEDKAQYVAPTCSSKGQQVYKCTNHTDCTVTVTVELDEAQHTIAQKVTDATCTTKGKVEAYCSVCDENCEKPFSTTEAPVVPHTLDNGTAYDATCTTSGYILYSCTAGCGFSYKEYDGSKPAIDHTYVSSVTTPAGCTTEGVMTYSCTCGDSYTAPVSPTGHSYNETETAATCTTAGTKTYTCTNTDCGYTYTEFVEEAAEHNWSNWATLQEATTDSYGIDKRSCANENCTAVEYRTTAPTGAHEFEKANETPATCTSEGSIEWKCKTHTDCEADYTETLDKLAHTQTISYTAPTCIADGSSKVVCSVCDTEIMSQTISATGIHNYSGDGVVTAEPTCTATGTMTYTCLTDGCTATKTETISAKGHDLTTTVTDAKCGEKGSVVIACSRCDDTSVEKTYELAAKNHSYDEGVETTAPSCEATGEKTYTCTLCGATKTETIAATGHSWSDWVVTPSTNSGAGSVSRECLVAGCDGTETIEIPAGNHNLVVSSETAATCTTEGSITYTCDTAHEGDVNCGITITVALDKLQHELETTKTDATCTGDGSVVTKCKNCDTETHTTIIPATKHNYEGVVTTPATCTVEGTKTYTCSKCNDSYTEAIAKLQHVYTAGSTTAPTCTTNGYTTYKCDNCTSSYTIITESKTGHTFDTANAEVSASCEADGETIVKCACGETLSISTEALGHTYKLDSTAEATCAEGAKETYKCSRCGDSYTVTVSAKSNDYNVHSWNAWVTAKEATNTSIGYKTRSCKICEKLEVEEIAATGEHVFTVLESETPAGCETAGEKVYSCATHTDCGLTSTVTIPATGHTEELQYQAAACETVGSTKIVCDTCKATIGDETEIAALGHLFDGDGEYVAATCVAEGSMTYTCSRDDCEEKHITTISVDSDAHSLKKETKATSCKEEGYIKVTCENTGCTYSETTTLPKLQHSWGEWRVETAATNSADGVMKRTCSNGCEETCVIPAGNHKFDTTAPASTTAATCEIQGTATYNCTAHTDCGVTITVNTGLAEHIYKTEVVESCSENGSVKTICEVCEKEISSVALGKAQHKFNVTETVDATCTTSGYKIYKCDNCDETYNEINGNALGHEFTEKVSSDATCTTGGTMTLKCANCTETMSADVPALGHDYQKISSTPETCAAAATETYKCSRCDASYTISVGSKSATHTYIDNWTTVKEATATSIGYKTRACQVCGQLELQTIEATGEHQFETGEVVETKSATCTENGYEIRECSVHTDCGETAEITLLATGHTEEAIDAVAATCESAGSSAGTKCSVCGTVLDAPVTLPALEHKWEIKNITPATCKAEGKIEYTCSRDNCDETHEAAIEIDKDAHKYETTVTPASCIADGSVVTTCSLCGDTTTVTLTAKGHVWNDTAASTTFATCENSGSATYKCKHCDAENVVTLAPIGHTYEAGEKVAATCTTSGYTVYTCKNDSSHFYKVYDENEKATGHSFNGTETIVSDATCTADGEKTVKCETCSETTTVIIHKLGHAYGSWEVVKEATNTEDGQWKRVCANDESHIEYVTIPAGNHEWDDGTEILAPTCETEGTMLYKCKTHTGENACGITFETTIPATEHYYYASDTKDATCINEGEMLYECDCGASYTEPIPVKAHELSTTVTEATCTAEGSVVTECVNCDYEVTESLTQKPHTISVSYAYPSCTNDGYVKESCDKCDYEKIISTTAALGHDYNGEETVTKEATCLEKGEKTVKCSRCDATTTEEISATGHNYKAGDEVEATCTASGYIPYTCQNDGCTSSYRDLTSEPNGHKWNNTAESKTDATCETDGKAIYRCQFCDATNEVVTSKYGHSWTGWTITKAPTATEEGEKTRTCLRGCKETVSIPAIGSATTYKVDFVIDGEIIFSQTVGHLGSATAPEVSAKTPDAKYHYSFNWDTDFSVVSSDLTVTGIYTPVSHSYGEWVTDREADCKNEGLRHRECTCGYVQEETVAKAEHSFTVVTEEKAPTCTDNGYKVVTCEYCGESETQTVKKLGHAMTYYQGVAATCTTDGVASHYSCSRCGKNFEDRAGRTELSGIVINRKYHTYVVVEGKAPTCTEQGVTDYRYCTACGYTQNPEPIAATGHADVNNDNSCDKCGATYMQGGQIICSCSCHKTGFFNELIYKLLSFFWRLFGSNKSCECGRVHY